VHGAHLHTLAPQMEVANSVVCRLWMFLVERKKARPSALALQPSRAGRLAPGPGNQHANTCCQHLHALHAPRALRSCWRPRCHDDHVAGP
jgi:hypothetical protein